jgi:hypothetical protein
MTLWPLRRNSTAQAYPMPLEQPVTKIVLDSAMGVNDKKGYLKVFPDYL